MIPFAEWPLYVHAMLVPAYLLTVSFVVAFAWEGALLVLDVMMPEEDRS